MISAILQQLQPIVICARRKIGHRAVSVAALSAWNQLPNELKLPRLTVSSKRHLKAFLNSVMATRLGFVHVVQYPNLT